MLYDDLTYKKKQCENNVNNGKSPYKIYSYKGYKDTDYCEDKCNKKIIT